MIAQKVWALLASYELLGDITSNDLAKGVKDLIGDFVSVAEHVHSICVAPYRVSSHKDVY